MTSTGHTTGTVKFWVDLAKFTVAQFLMASLPGPFTMGSKRFSRPSGWLESLRFERGSGERAWAKR